MMYSASPFPVPVGCFEVPPPMPCVYEYEEDDHGMDEMYAYSPEIDEFFHHQPTLPACLQPMPRLMTSAESLAPSWPVDIDMEVSLLRCGMMTMQIAVPLAAVATYDEPTTTVTELRAPFSYRDDIEKKTEDETSKNRNKKMDPSWTYDADIDATLRDMEKDPAHRPSETDVWEMQKMTLADRAGLVELMYCCCMTRELPPGTLHRAVNYFDRYLSLKKIEQDHRLLLAITAVLTAAKYESRAVEKAFNADVVASYVGGSCTRRDVLDMERDLLATLSYLLSGPTAYTFVEHFTRHDDEEKTSKEIKKLAHHLVEMTLLHYCTVESLPSAMAASAILLATRHIINSDEIEHKMLKMVGYKLEDLSNIIDAINELHEHVNVWPGCERMVSDFAKRSRCSNQ